MITLVDVHARYLLAWKLLLQLCRLLLQLCKLPLQLLQEHVRRTGKSHLSINEMLSLDLPAYLKCTSFPPLHFSALKEMWLHSLETSETLVVIFFVLLIRPRRDDFEKLRSVFWVQRFRYAL